MRPLEGVCIIDLSRVLAGPFATMILAELGASVIKVERPGTGDETRHFEPLIGDESAYFFACNRSKRSVAVNFTTPAGQEIIRRLVHSSDVLVENFPTGTLARYGLDQAVLRAENPGLVYVSCTGFGQSGPYADRKGYDTVFMAMGGLMSLTGEPGGGPVKPGLPIADLTSGLWLAIAVLSALAGRAKTGSGAYIDFSMLDGQVSLLTLAAARFFALGEVPEPMGTQHPGRVPSASFQCLEGEWLHITCSDQHWAGLCGVLGLGEWGLQPDLRENSGRLARRAEVMERLIQAIAAWERDALVRACLAADVPVGPVNRVDTVLSDPHVLARGMVASFEHPTLGSFPALPLPFAFDGFDDPRLARPPLLGEHTDAVLAELGYSAAEITELRVDKVI